MTNNEHIERLDSLADELDKAMAFLDPPTPGETYWQELDAVSIRAGAAALRGVEGAKAALEHAMRIFAINGLSSKGIDRIAAALNDLRYVAEDNFGNKGGPDA
jgi:hypothetical protein